RVKSADNLFDKHRGACGMVNLRGMFKHIVAIIGSRRVHVEYAKHNSWQFYLEILIIGSKDIPIHDC
ncbi:MAG: hypothetical protein ACU0CA_07880, partial [Paracoccaceae bacterium]